MKSNDKAVIVAGAAGGIGTQICSELQVIGYNVVALDVVEPTEREGDGIRRFAVDCSDPDALEVVIDKALDGFGQLHGAVNTTGAFRIRDFIETGRDDWLADLRANLLTAMAVSRVAVPRLLEHGSGSIVNIASTAGEVGSFRPAAGYSAAKGGVIAFTKSLAREISPSGVRVNAISPGPVMTSMVQINSEAEEKETSKRTLLGRVGQPKDIAGAVRFLLSEESSWVTGTVMQVNGGCAL